MAIRADRLKQILTVGAEYLLATVFLVSVIGKIQSPGQFLTFVESASSLPAMDPEHVLLAIVIVEGILVALLVVDRTATAGVVASFLILLAFSSIQLIGLNAGVVESCGSLGSLMPDTTPLFSVARNTFLLLICFGPISRFNTENRDTAWSLFRRT